MSSFRELKRRIGGVQNIQQITRAMKMVAAARLRRAEEAILALRPYSLLLDRLCARFLQGAIGSEDPFFEERPVKGVALMVVCSDRGLCGSYNNRALQATQELLARRTVRQHSLVAVGKRGIDWFKRNGYEVHAGYQDIFNPVRYVTARLIARDLMGLFLAGKVDEVLVLFSEFFSPLRQVLVTRKLLPCHPAQHAGEIRDHYDRELPQGLDFEPLEIASGTDQVYIYEPQYESICHRLIEHNISVQVYRALLEAQASEHGARMMAMSNATENAEEMIEELTLRMHRVRQEDITSELLDVVGGAEAVR